MMVQNVHIFHTHKINILLFLFQVFLLCLEKKNLTGVEEIESCLTCSMETSRRVAEEREVDMLEKTQTLKAI